MCFTIEVHLSRKAIEDRFKIDASALRDFDYAYFYVAFTNPMIPVVAAEQPTQVTLKHWGLIPAWTRDRAAAEKIRKGTYNARSETLHEKPSFREPLKRGRCLILAHGFFEWQHEAGAKIPWYIKLKNDTPFAFAGLYDRWADRETGELIEGCSIITTAANPLMEKIHNTKKRMPVILSAKDEMKWIDPEISTEEARQLLLPLDEKFLHAHKILPGFNTPGSDPQDPSILKEADNQGSGLLF